MKVMHDYYVFDRTSEKLIGFVPAVNDSVARKTIIEGLKDLFSKCLLDLNEVRVVKMRSSYAVYETYFEVFRGYVGDDGNLSKPDFEEITDFVFDHDVKDSDRMVTIE